MADLATTPGRRQTQRRLTTNRSSVLPTRRDTDTPSLVVRSDLRTAARGDGGADELRQTLSQFLGAGARLHQVQTEARKPLYEQQRADGEADALLGTEDAARMDKQLAYSTAVHRARARQAVVGVAAAIRGEIEDLVAAAEAGDDPLDPSGDFGPEDVEEVINRRYQELLTEEDGSPKSWGDAEAHRTLIQGLDRLKNEVWTEAEAAIRKQTDQRHMAALGTEISLDIAQHGTEGHASVDFEGRVEAARRAGISAAQSVPVFLDQAIIAARQHKKPDALDILAQSVREDGLPSLNPAQKLQVLNAAQALRTQMEREEKEAKEKTTNETIASWMLADRPPGRSEIMQAYSEGKLTTQGVTTALSYLEHLDDQAWEDESRAYTRQERRRLSASRASGASGGRRQSSGDMEDLLAGALYSETATPQQVLASANAGLASGALNAAEHRRIVKDVTEFRDVDGLIDDSKARPEFRRLTSIMSRTPTTGTISQQQRDAATAAFARTLRNGGEPRLALANGLFAMGVPADTAADVVRTQPEPRRR